MLFLLLVSDTCKGYDKFCTVIISAVDQIS